MPRKRSLVQVDAINQRRYFQEVLRLYGIDSMYYGIEEGTKVYNESGELSAEYKDPLPTQILFDQVPTISTLKKLGWTSELDKSQPLIHVDYDLENIQTGCLFNVEDPFRPGKGRLFRITKMATGIIYPMCITCQVVAILGDTPEKTLQPDKSVKINNQRGLNIIRPEKYD